MSQLNIKNLWIQQVKVNDENIFKLIETKIVDVEIELNEEENKIYERIIEKIEENLEGIGKEWQEEETEMPQEWDMRDEIPEETNTRMEDITLKDMEEIDETIKGYGNSFIKEIYEEIMKEIIRERSNGNDEETQENIDDDEQMEMDDEENLSEELSELEDEAPRTSRKRRNEDETQNTRKKRRTGKKSGTIEKLIQELETPVFEEENIEEETEEDTEGSEIRILIRMFYGIEKVNRKQIKEWFNYGRRFEQNVEETKNRSRKRIADQTARGKVYEEMKKQMPGIVTKEALRKRTQGAVKVYEIFMEIGREKINRIKDCTVDTIIKLNREEIKQIKNHFRRK